MLPFFFEGCHDLICKGIPLITQQIRRDLDSFIYVKQPAKLEQPTKDHMENEY
jgi:hypothetical protein